MVPPPVMENQMEETVETGMDAGILQALNPKS